MRLVRMSFCTIVVVGRLIKRGIRKDIGMNYTIKIKPDTAALSSHGLLAHVSPEDRKRIYAGGKEAIRAAERRIEAELKRKR